MENRQQIIKILNNFLENYNMEGVCGFWLEEERGDEDEIWVYMIIDLDFIKKLQLIPNLIGSGLRNKLKKAIKDYTGFDVQVGSTSKKCDMIKEYKITESQLQKIVKQKLNEQEDNAPKGKCDLSKLGSGPTSAEEKAQCKLDKEVMAQYQANIRASEAQRQKDFSDLIDPRKDIYLTSISKKDPTFTTAYQQFLNSNPDLTNLSDRFTPEQRFAILNKIAGRSKRNSSWYIISAIKKRFGIPEETILDESKLLQYIKNMGGFDEFKKWFMLGMPLKS